MTYWRVGGLQENGNTYTWLFETKKEALLFWQLNRAVCYPPEAAWSRLSERIKQFEEKLKECKKVKPLNKKFVPWDDLET